MAGKPTRPKGGGAPGGASSGRAPSARPTRGRPAAGIPASGRPAAGRAGIGGSRPGGSKPGGPGTAPAGEKRHSRSPRPSKPRPTAPPRRRATDPPQAVLELYRPDLARILAGADAPPFRYVQVLEHLFNRPGADFAAASALPADLRSALSGAGTSVLEVVATREAADGTTKLLLAAADGAQVETVSMPYGKRLTVCISSQVGCAVGCAFCATGALGFRRNLTTTEIVDQIRAAVSLARPDQRLTNVVYMGMGEPLLNLGAVLNSVRVLTASSTFGLGHRALSISTVGIPDGMLRLAQAEPQVNLALSLHAADDATRALLIPEKFRHPIAAVLEAAWQHFAITRRKLLLEYVLIGGVNDSVDDARRLAGLLRGRVVTVNLLNWNPVCPEDAEATGPASPRGTSKKASLATQPQGRTRMTSLPVLLPSSPAAISAFRAALRASHVESVLRQSKGAGIEAACGQLAGSVRSYTQE
jgi:23S rRNA (adenine2503-C2)-methyltransferase